MDGRWATPVPSLYVHVPFCLRKCHYCAFDSGPADLATQDRYVAALAREFARLAPKPKPATIFFGGGTPSLLSVRHWQDIFQALERCGLSGAAEFTIECNPATVTPDHGRCWQAAGVNRLSLGVQSLDDRLLERLGRAHTRQEVFQTYDLLRKLGFNNLNLDLIFAIPGQTREVWGRTLAEALALGSEHLSAYELTYEEDTPLFHQLRSGVVQAEDDLACDLYEDLVQAATAHGYQHYEVANFARHLAPTPADIPDRACQHNVNYWRGGSFFGCGPSATSYVHGVRTRNVSDTLRYCQLLEQDQSPQEFREQLSPLARAGEIAAFGLRLTAGWPWHTFQQVTGVDLREVWPTEIQRLLDNGWARADHERFQLTPLGLRFADAAAREFLRPDAV